MEHLNVSKGKTVSDLEAFFILVDKLLSAKIEDGSKGIIIAKGQSNEKKFTYRQAKEVLSCMENSSALRGCFSLGVCDTCERFNTQKYSSPFIGECMLNHQIHGRFDTCDKHSKKGGGFGI